MWYMKNRWHLCVMSHNQRKPLKKIYFSLILCVGPPFFNSSHTLPEHNSFLMQFFRLVCVHRTQSSLYLIKLFLPITKRKKEKKKKKKKKKKNWMEGKIVC